MSLDTLSPDAVERAQQQIRTIVAEITQLARSDMEPREFFTRYVPRVIQAVAAVGGAVWTINGDGKSFDLLIGEHLPRTGVGPDRDSQAQHARLIGEAIVSGESLVIPAGPRAADEEDLGNPTPYLLLLVPLTNNGRPLGVVELFQRPGIPHSAQRGNLNFLKQMGELAASYLAAHDETNRAERESQWTRLAHFGRAVHQSLDLPTTAYTLANEARRLIDCDRVSVAIRRRCRVRIEAVSGQDTVERRANVVRLLANLVDRVLATGEPMWYSGDTSQLAPQVEEALSAFVNESHTRTLGIVPLVQHLPTAPNAEKPPQPKILGALVIERIDEEGLTETIRRRTKLVCDHGVAAVANALEHDQVFLMPVWRTLGKSRWFVEARRLPKTVAITGLLLAAVAASCVIPADFRVTATGTLQPAKRQDVFVQEPGVISRVLVDHGDQVKAGADLIRLRSRDLEVAITEVRGRRAATLEQLASARRSQAEPRLTFDERNRISGQYAQLQKTADSLTNQLELLLEKQKLLTIHSPLEGTVVTWDLKKRLDDRPVERGQLLLSVADPKSPWELELLVPEAHAGYVASAWQQAPQGKRSLDVNYILATNPANSRTGNAIEVQSSAEVRGDDGNTVLVRVRIDRDSLDPSELRPGATVTGRIYCGRRAIG
ncbi:MAG: GAF domain-containing protein, partial [Planctomycetia bacterium]|nr:GAF domain-containing protein [Planctomycetia bacterium]